MYCLRFEDVLLVRRACIVLSYRGRFDILRIPRGACVGGVQVCAENTAVLCDESDLRAQFN